MKSVIHYPAMKINVPEWYVQEDFQNWLNSSNVATWHIKGEKPNEFSDVFIWYENYESSDSNMPEAIWEELCQICDDEDFTFGYIHLTNLEFGYIHTGGLVN